MPTKEDARSAKYRLINPDSKGPVIAMPTPARKAVSNSSSEEAAKKRRMVPTPMRSRDHVNVRSNPHRLLILTAIGENSPIHSTGIEVRRLAKAPFIPRSFRIVSNNGAIEEMAGRKLMEARNNAHTK